MMSLRVQASLQRFGAHLLPKQGMKQPWKVHQSYLRDYRALKMSDIDDSIMEFSGSVTPDRPLEPVST